MGEVTPPLAPVSKIVSDVVNGKISEILALFLIDKHLELARSHRIVTRRDQIAALVMPAIIQIVDRERHFDTREFESRCWARAYSLADAGDPIPR